MLLWKQSHRISRQGYGSAGIEAYGIIIWDLNDLEI